MLRVMGRRELQMDAAVAVTLPRTTFSQTMINLLEVQHWFQLPVSMNQLPYWNQGLTNAIKQTLEFDTKFLFFVDGDAVFDTDQVYDLYRMIDRDDSIDAICPVQAQRNAEQPILYNWQCQMFGDVKYDYRQPMSRMYHAHFGCTFIRSEVFRSVPEPWLWGQPAQDGSWDLKPNKVDDDTFFWLKRHQHRPQQTVQQANYIVVGHMELAIRWQNGPSVICQTLPEYEREGRPMGLRAPTIHEMEERKKGLAALNERHRIEKLQYYIGTFLTWDPDRRLKRAQDLGLDTAKFPNERDLCIAMAEATTKVKVQMVEGDTVLTPEPAKGMIEPGMQVADRKESPTCPDQPVSTPTSGSATTSSATG